MAPAGRELVVLELRGGRLCLRPSGTEPKLKIYIEVWEPGAYASVEHAAEALAVEVRAWVEERLASVVVSATVPQ